MKKIILILLTIYISNAYSFVLQTDTTCVLRIQSKNSINEIYLGVGSKIKIQSENIKVKGKILNITNDSIFIKNKNYALKDITKIKLINSENYIALGVGSALVLPIFTVVGGSVIFFVVPLAVGIGIKSIFIDLKSPKYTKENSIIDIIKVASVNNINLNKL
jgi:hypothetical protein